MKSKVWIEVLVGWTLCLTGVQTHAAPGQIQEDRDRGTKVGDTISRASEPISRLETQPGSDLSKEVIGYVIGPGDILSITVWKEADLSRTVAVRPDGRISLPMLGELTASGHTGLELQRFIEVKLRTYVRNPQVNVSIEQIKSRTFNVLGKVSKAGSFELTKPTRVLDAIAMAGGFLEFAHVTKIYVLRRSEEGSQSMIRFNYKRVIKGQDEAMNIALQPGDTVVVP